VDDEDEEKGIMHDQFFKSNFEKRKEKVRQELDVLESEQVGDRPWHLMGETSAKNRDGDELLGMDLDFDATRPDVVPTVEMTEDLEKIIIQRIRDKGTDQMMEFIGLQYPRTLTSHPVLRKFLAMAQSKEILNLNL